MILSIPNLVYAQISQLREILVEISSDTTLFLADWVKTGSIQVFVDGNHLENDNWAFQELTGNLSLHLQSDSVKSVVIQYVEMRYPLSRNYAAYRPRSLSYDQVYGDSVSSPIPLRNSSQNDFSSNLNQKGSLSRGIIVGSNQDFALESGLQFELSGQLTDDIYLNAILTDRSIPIQPDGTTQNLREFDKVLIQLEGPRTIVEMGDVDVLLENSTFARLNRRLQGATGITKTKAGSFTGVASAVRGSFKTINFQGEDGFQGPYRLTGNNDEEFVIILAGTEHVYLNGQPVQRGEESDYIIDYGLGEITFTNNVLIKDETRIFVEYEYVDQNFNRTLLAAEANEQFFEGKFGLGVSVIRSADSDEYLSQQSLSEEDINTLRQVGDNLNAAVVSGVSTNPDEDTNILYAQIDTVYNGATYQIYQFSVSGMLQVRFSEVGDGNGTYARVGTSANGLLYEWVGPGNGSYDPFRRLPAPEKKQMVSVNSFYNVTDHIQLYGEWAASGYDQNRFSSIDDGDNNDIAYISGAKIQELPTSIGDLSVSFRRRFSGSNFVYFDRTKEVEFNRKWNVTAVDEGEETIDEAVVSLAPGERTDIGVEFGSIDRLGFKGWRQASSLNSSDIKRLNVRYNQDWLQSQDELLSQNGNWFKQLGTIGYELGEGWEWGLRFEQEVRNQRDSQSDSLLNSAFSFYEILPTIGYRNEKLDASLGVGYRQDRKVMKQSIQKESEAIEQMYELNWRPSSYFNTQNKVRIRQKEYTADFEVQGQTNRRALLIESVTNYETQGEGIVGQLFYSANTQRQALLQEAYIEVGPELGQYVWIDENDDGVEQIDEFFIELSPNEGTYVKQYLPTDNLLPVVDLNVRLRNEIKPFAQKNDGREASDFLKSITVFSRFQIVENSITQNLEDIYLLRFRSFRDDSTTLQGRFIWEKEIEMTPGSLQWRLGISENRMLNQQTNDRLRGFSQNIWVATRLELNKSTSMRLNTQLFTDNSISELLTSRSYRISGRSFSPGVEWTFNRTFQSSFSSSYITKKDDFPEIPAKVRMVKFSNSSRAYLLKKIQASSTLEVRNTWLTGASNTQGLYQLTEGTGTGTNVIWSLSAGYRISQMVRFSLNYDGRTVNKQRDIHTVKLVMSAVF